MRGGGQVDARYPGAHLLGSAEGREMEVSRGPQGLHSVLSLPRPSSSVLPAGQSSIAGLEPQEARSPVASRVAHLRGCDSPPPERKILTATDFISNAPQMVKSSLPWNPLFKTRRLTEAYRAEPLTGQVGRRRAWLQEPRLGVQSQPLSRAPEVCWSRWQPPQGGPQPSEEQGSGTGSQPFCLSPTQTHGAWKR